MEKKGPRIALLSLVGAVSFVFFLYLSFPYEILKEAVAVKAASATGMAINIGEMKPKFPVGITVEKLSVGTASGARLEIEKASASVSIFKLLIGKLGVQVDLEDKSSGYLDLTTDFGLLSLIKNPASPPARIVVDAAKFEIGSIVDFLLHSQAESPAVNQMIKPLFHAFAVVGKLSADVDLSLDAVEPVNSEGSLDISVDNMILKVVDPNMTIPQQDFKKAKILAKLLDGRLSFDGTSGLSSRDLDISIGGQVSQRPEIKLDLLIGVQLREDLKSQFSWMMDAAAHKETNGQIEIHVGGSLDGGPQMKIL